MPSLHFTDQMGRQITLPHFPPRRIVSLVPSQTELLAWLGLERHTVGITKFCIRPAEWFESKPRVGGTKTISFEKIEALEPDLILGNREENERDQIQALAGKHPVWMSDIQNLADACAMIRAVGALTGTSERASELASRIEQSFRSLPAAPTGPRVAYLIWRKPYMAAATDTYINSMLQAAGFRNAFESRSRYPEIRPDELADAAPEAVFLSSEPYPFGEKHLAEIRALCPGIPVLLVDGEMFSWYGPRLLQAAEYFQSLRQSEHFAAHWQN